MGMMIDSSRLAEAEEFFNLPELENKGRERWPAVRREIEETGTYQHTAHELEVGAKIAWRNHARCIGRGQWRALRIIDARHCRTPAEIASACWYHLRFSTNSGRIRPTITIFRAEQEREGAIRIINPQLIRYAGYPRPDGTVLGDPAHIELTSLAQELGWKSKDPTAFDILPLIIQIGKNSPQVFPIPQLAVLEVDISHPVFAWFSDLGLRWHANPAISNLCLEIGGLRYTAAPFTGWYVSSEIGARNFTDSNRYNILRLVAERMNLDTSRTHTLWKDRALVEINAAVLHSYRKAGVTIVDHHQASQQFVSHCQREREAGRATPAEWEWINPPLSASVTATYHRNYDPVDDATRPNFVAQETVQCPFR
ncbi:nitric oxide synthase oxygenase [Streptomyces chartreusis]|uniref:nitric oxide synthase oxygenase n=1 Tax=Streptomyces chartreusis TaxID=1969 RepID=UPI0037F46569